MHGEQAGDAPDGHSPPAPAPGARPRALPTALACAGIVLGAFVLAAALRSTRPTPPRQAAPPEARLGVCVFEAQPRAVAPEVEGLARARAARRVVVSAQVGGLVLALDPRLEAGLVVPAGAVAVRLDPADARLARDEAAARLAGARAEHDRLAALRASLDARARVARDLLALERAEVERLRALVGQGILREREPEAARLAVLRQEDALEALEAQRAQLGPQLAGAAAAAAEAEAREAMAALALARCEVRAPLGGLVAARSVEVGQLVAAGQALFEVWEVARVELPVALPVAQALLLAPGLEVTPGAPPPEAGALAQVEVVVQAERGRGGPGWSGRLVRLEPVDAATQTVRAVVVVGEAQGASTPGAPPGGPSQGGPTQGGPGQGGPAAGVGDGAGPDAGAGYPGGEPAPPPAAGPLPGELYRVTLRAPRGEPALVVPLGALQERGRLLLAADTPGGSAGGPTSGLVLEVREVTLGRRLGPWVEVVGGLAAGERVIVSPVERPIAGLPVRVVEGEPAPAGPGPGGGPDVGQGGPAPAGGRAGP